MDLGTIQRLIAATTFIIFIFAIPLSARADCQVTLQWDPNTEPILAGYKIFMRTEADAYDYTWPEWQGSSTQCTVPELDEDTVYYFVVRAVDSSDIESGDSNEVRFRYAEATPPDDSEPDHSSILDNDSNSNDSYSPDSSSSGGCFIESLLAP